MLPRFIYFAGAAVLLALLFAVPQTLPIAAAQQPVADSAASAAEITRLMHKFSDAAEANNKAVLDSLVAPDAWWIQPTGVRHTGAEWLANVNKEQTFTKHDVTRLVVHVHGGDVAIAASEQNTAGTRYTGQPMTGRGYATRIWVQRDGRWQIVMATTSLPRGAK